MSDPLEAVRQAERLVREATERAERIAEGHVPPQGFGSSSRDGGAFPDLSALTGLLELARGSLPPDLQRQVAQALRELLIALRAVLDYSIERLEPSEAARVEVEDIPIE